MHIVLLNAFFKKSMFAGRTRQLCPIR